MNLKDFANQQAYNLARAEGVDLGINPLIPIGISAVGVGLFSWLTSRELTESTDYGDRLECVRRATEDGYSRSEALRICGVDGGLNWGLLAALGVGALLFFSKKD